MSDKPSNILIFMTDQQHAGTVCPSHRLKAKTPNIDRFREQSVSFTQAYCPSPHCCPSRASFFTSLFPSEHGVWNNVNVTNALSRGLFPSVRPWSVDLREAGYDLGFVGKWHVSNHQSPAEYGWNIARLPGAKIMAKGDDSETQYQRARDRELKRLMNTGVANPGPERAPGQIHRPGYESYTHYGVRENPFRDSEVVDLGASELQRLADGNDPWCLYVGTLGPHDPYTPPARFLAMYDDDELPPLPPSFHDPMDDKPALYRRTRDRFSQLTEDEHRQAIRHYLAFCSYEDALFGQMLDTLDQTGQADQTMVVFLSDHGDYVGEHGLWCKGLPAFDSAYHVPAIVRMPKKESQSQSSRESPPQSRPRSIDIDAPVSLLDFGPTFLELAGVKTTKPMSGQSLMSWLNGQKPDAWRDSLFFQTNGNETYGIQRSVMTSKWKLVFNAFDYDELYNRRDDPDQLYNLAKNPAYHEIVRELYALLWQHMIRHGDDYINTYIMTALAEYGPVIQDK